MTLFFLLTMKANSLSFKKIILDLNLLKRFNRVSQPPEHSLSGAVLSFLDQQNWVRHSTALVALLGSIKSVVGMNGKSFEERVSGNPEARYGEKIKVEIPTHVTGLLHSNRKYRASGQLGYHVLKVMHAMQQSSMKRRYIDIESVCDKPAAMHFDSILKSISKECP